MGEGGIKMKKVYYCPECYNIRPIKGYLILDEENSFCKKHNIQRIEKNININDFNDISWATKTNSECIEAMIKLKEEDPIEYQLKMAQFRELAKQRRENFEEACRKSEEESQPPKPKCPTCGSTNIGKISGTKRWFSTGLFGIASSDVGKSMVCKNCGYKSWILGLT